MKTFKVTIEYTGLAGPYRTVTEVVAKTAKSATAKASKAIGNRDAYVVSVIEKELPNA